MTLLFTIKLIAVILVVGGYMVAAEVLIDGR